MKSNNENLDNTPWISRLNAGDVAAFEWLYNSFKYQLAQKLLRLVKSPDIAEDLLHDIFVKIWDNRGKIDINRSLEGYIHRIAANSVADFYRQISNDQKYRKHLVNVQETDYLHVEEVLENKHQRALIDKALADLPPKCRTVFELCKIEGRSYEEVAELLH